MIWNNADSPHPALNSSPLTYGWKEIGGYYVPLWYEGNMLPDKVTITPGLDASSSSDADEETGSVEWSEHSDPEELDVEC